MLATWHWHIEISSKCALKCPRCARQEVPETLVNTELDLSFFKKTFTEDFILKNVEKITFCGDDGDPIYAHDLIEVIKYFKSVKPVEIVIVTNGSYKNENWWKLLGNTLTSLDSVHFSIDGYDNTSNNLYRFNSDYTSIINGIKSLKKNSECKIIWACIAFKFNQDRLKELKEFAFKLGVDRFQLTKSTKFGSKYPSYGENDKLEPIIALVSNTNRFERELTDFSNKSYAISSTNIKLYEKNKKLDPIVPLCFIGNKGLYIDSRGRLFPCCWVANRYNHNSEWQQLADKFNLHTKTLADVLSDNFWNTQFLSFKWQECQTKCNCKIMTKDYATSW